MTPFLGAWERLVLMRDGYYSTDNRRRRRAAMLLSLDRGNSAATVARMSGCSRTTVYYWLHLYKQYRDVSVLAFDKVPGDQRAKARACARVNSLEPESAGRRCRLPGGLLPLKRTERNNLCREALTEPQPRRKLVAAMAWAIERGIPPLRVAKAAKVSRQSARQAWLRARQRLEPGDRGVRNKDHS
jgi:hypothetical protein